MFIDYGEEWLDTREGTFADKIPRREDFITAASVVSKLDKSMTRNKITMNGTIEYWIIIADFLSTFCRIVHATHTTTNIVRHSHFTK